MGTDGSRLSCPGSGVVAEDASEEYGFKNDVPDDEKEQHSQELFEW